MEENVVINRRPFSHFFGKLLNELWYETFVLEDDIEQERKQQQSCHHCGHDHVGHVPNELDIECSRDHEVSRI